MRNFVGVGVVGMVSLLSAGAQIPAHSVDHRVVVRVDPPSLSCPVEMAARRTPVGAVAYAGGAEQQSGSNGVHVSLTATASARIREASLTVHALSARGRLLSASSSAAPDMAKDFHLAAGKQGSAELGGDASVDPKATVISVDLNELVYADGRVWRPAVGAGCHVEPDGFLPVASVR